LDWIFLYVQFVSTCLVQNVWMESPFMFNLSVLHVWFKTFGWNRPLYSTCLVQNLDGITVYVQLVWFKTFGLNQPVCSICQYFISGSKLLDGIALYVQIICSSCLVQNFWMETPCMFSLSTWYLVQKFWIESPCMFNLSVLHVWFKTFGWNHHVYWTCLFFMSGSKLGWNHHVCSSCLVQNF
jgi:hypothetical protein